MAAAMISDRELRRKAPSITENNPNPKRAPKRRHCFRQSQQTAAEEQNNNQTKKKRYNDTKSEMHGVYQPWVIQTYGDLAKTKTITLKKYARILRALKGEEVNNVDSSKFRFWVKAKGFYIGKPPGYDPKPADAIIGRYGIEDDVSSENPTGAENDPALYVPSVPMKNSPKGTPAYRKVAVVENFFDIIYSVHVELEGRGGKHAGQKRTYRTITETYAFLPREAVTRFLMGCTDCQRRPRSISPSPTSITAVPIPTPSPTPSPPPKHISQVTLSPTQNALITQIHPQYDPSKLQDWEKKIAENSTPSPALIASNDYRYGSDSENIGTNGIKTEYDGFYGTSHNGTNGFNIYDKPCIKIESERSAFRKIRPPKRRADTDYQNGIDYSMNNNEVSSLDLSKKVEPYQPSNVSSPELPERPVEVKKPYNPLDICNLTSKDPPKSPSNRFTISKSYDIDNNGFLPQTFIPKSVTPSKKRHLYIPKEQEEQKVSLSVPWTPGSTSGGIVDYSMPITTTYLKHMRSLGLSDDDAMRLDGYEPMTSDHPSEHNDDIDQYPGLVKDAEKLKLMLLAWNYHSQAQARAAGGDSDTPVIPPLANDDVAGLWASYHSALGLTKGRSPPRENSSPVLLAGGETGSAHDETSSSGHKDDEEGSEDESDDRIDTLAHDPERLKAFNMFVRLFVDENLDRMVPISKQPKEKIQAIIDSCTRQFPEFAERARKRIRTYLKSCRRNKKVRDGTGTWDSSARPTPAHLTSVQAEQILAQACENESHNAKRMRVGLEPVSQPMPASTSSPAETTIAPSLSHYPIKSEEASISSLGAAYTTVTSTPTAPTIPKPQTSTTNSRIVADPPGPVSCLLLNGGLSNATCTSTTPTSLYRPNFTQAFQRTTSTATLATTSTPGYTGALFPGQTFNPAVIGNGPTDLSMKTRPLLTHKLSGLEMGAVRALVTGYRESAAFLLRSADELEALLLQQ